jgi:CHAT domain-containing protein/tetratricopeptide (TPR) repeat protein
MNEEHIQQYLGLIEKILSCPNKKAINKILDASMQLVDRGLTQRMVLVAEQLQKNGQIRESEMLREMSEQLADYVDSQPQPPFIQMSGGVEEFVKQLLLAANRDEESGDYEVGCATHRLMEANLEMVNVDLGMEIAQFLQAIYQTERPDQAERMIDLIENVFSRIQIFPNKEQTETFQIAIIGYEAILELRTKNSPKCLITLTKLGKTYIRLAELGDKTIANSEKAIILLENAKQIYSNLAELGDKTIANSEKLISLHNDTKQTKPEQIFSKKLAEVLDALGLAYLSLAEAGDGDETSTNLEKAIANYDHAAKIIHDAGLIEESAETHTNLGFAYLKSAELGFQPIPNLGKATAAFNRSKQIRLNGGLTLSLTDTDNDIYLGIAYMLFARAGIEPIPNANKAITIFEQAEQAYQIHSKHGLTYNSAGILKYLGNSYQVLSNEKVKTIINLEKAIDAYERAAAIFSKANLKRDLASVLSDLGVAYHAIAEMGIKLTVNLEKAIDAYERADAILSEANLNIELINVLNGLGNAYVLLDAQGGAPIAGVSKAIDVFNHALAIIPEGLIQLSATIHFGLGNAYLQLSERIVESTSTSNRKKAMENYELSFLQCDFNMFPMECMTFGQSLSEIYHKQKQWADLLRVNLKMIASAKNLRKLTKNEQERRKVMENVMTVYATAVEACIELNDYPQAIALAESSRARYLVELMATNDLYKNGEIAPEIRDWLDRHRPELETLWQEYNTLQSEIEIRQVLEEADDSKLLVSATTPTLKHQVDTLKKTIAEVIQLRKEQETIWQKIRNLDPVLAGLLEVDAPDFTTIQKLIDRPNTAILSFYTTSDRTYVFVLRSANDGEKLEEAISVHTCEGQGWSTLQDWIVNNWLIPYLPDETEQNLSQQIYNWQNEQETCTPTQLINAKAEQRNSATQRINQWKDGMGDRLAELAEFLHINQLLEKLEGINEIILIPHMLLHIIPFAALPISPRPMGEGLDDTLRQSKGERANYLGDRFKIRYAPSAQVLKYCSDRAPISTNKRGSVEDATSDLFFAQVECDIIAQIFNIPDHLRLQRQNATVSNYQKLTTEINHLHSSHHASSDLGSPLNSALALADGKVTLGQLMTPLWRMEDLDEIFLSCCETNLGIPKATDDLLTLGTGFLTAGARAVISTLWSVDSLATAFFCAFYYDYRNQGNDRPTAIDLAQHHLRTATVIDLSVYLDQQLQKAIATNNQNLTNNLNQALIQLGQYMKYANSCPFDSPFYWSAFICQGLR